MSGSSESSLSSLCQRKEDLFESMKDVSPPSAGRDRCALRNLPIEIRVQIINLALEDKTRIIGLYGTSSSQLRAQRVCYSGRNHGSDTFRAEFDFVTSLLTSCPELREPALMQYTMITSKHLNGYFALNPATDSLYFENSRAFLTFFGSDYLQLASDKEVRCRPGHRDGLDRWDASMEPDLSRRQLLAQLQHLIIHGDFAVPGLFEILTKFRSLKSLSLQSLEHDISCICHNHERGECVTKAFVDSLKEHGYNKSLTMKWLSHHNYAPRVCSSEELKALRVNCRCSAIPEDTPWNLYPGFERI